jgi:hypothetical protein
VASASFKNLQVMPKTTSPRQSADRADELRRSSRLGKAVTHCHDPKDPSAETPMKEKAREMMRMVNEINAKYPATMNRDHLLDLSPRQER